MKLTLENRTDFLYIEPEGELTIYNAAAIKDQLTPVFSAQQDVEINLSKVTDIDSAGIQLLLLTKRELLIAGRELRLTAHSRTIIELFELYNLSAYFGDPVLIVDSAEASE
jgi:anti-sigma B factor antagonist